MALFNEYIKINGVNLPVPPAFSITKEDVYAAEYKTCTGAIKADRIGWKYKDQTLSWDALTQNQVDTLVNMSGECTLEFVDADGAHSESIIRTSSVYLPHRWTVDGGAIWKNVSLEVRFINVHNN